MILDLSVMLGLVTLQVLIICLKLTDFLPVTLLLLLSLLLEHRELGLHFLVLEHPLVILLGDLLLLLPVPRLDLSLGELETIVVLFGDLFGEIHSHVLDVLLLLLEFVPQLADGLLEGELLLLFLVFFLKE